jgi:hypothetical protein
VENAYVVSQSKGKALRLDAVLTRARRTRWTGALRPCMGYGATWKIVEFLQHDGRTEPVSDPAPERTKHRSAHRCGVYCVPLGRNEPA